MIKSCGSSSVVSFIKLLSVLHRQESLSGDLPLRSVSPQSPLLAGELPPHAPSAFAPSPRKEGEEEESTEPHRHPTTQPHSNAMSGEMRRWRKEVLQEVKWGKITVEKVVMG